MVFGTTHDSTAINNALAGGSKIIDGGGLTYKINSALTIPANVELRNCNLVAGTAGMNMTLVNTGSRLRKVKLTGTGTVSIVERGVYPATSGVCDVFLDVEVTNLTFGVQPAPVAAAGSANNPKRWSGYIYAHDIVGTPGSSEGYGLLMESAESCSFVVRAKNIRRHALYLSAGASWNNVVCDVDGCGNYAAQIFALVPQAACQHNTVTLKTRNLTTDVAAQSGAIAIVGRAHYNTVTVFCTGNSTTYEAIRIEGATSGVQADVPKGNKIVNGSIDGQFTGGDVIRMLNADGTHVRNNTIDAYATSSVIATRRTGTNLALHGGYIEGNSINAQGQAIKGIYNEINTVPSYIGLNDIRNNGAALRVDDQTGGKRTGFSRRVVFSGTTASIGASTVGDTTVTLQDNIQVTGRQATVTLNGSSGSFFGAAYWTAVINAPSETQLTFRVSNGLASAQTFNYSGWVEGD